MIYRDIFKVFLIIFLFALSIISFPELYEVHASIIKSQCVGACVNDVNDWCGVCTDDQIVADAMVMEAYLCDTSIDQWVYQHSENNLLCEPPPNLESTGICSNGHIFAYKAGQPQTEITSDTGQITIKIDINPDSVGVGDKFRVQRDTLNLCSKNSNNKCIPSENNGTIELYLDRGNDTNAFNVGDHTLNVYKESISTPVCTLNYTVGSSIEIPSINEQLQSCSLSATSELFNNKILTTNSDVVIEGNGLPNTIEFISENGTRILSTVTYLLKIYGATQYDDNVVLENCINSKECQFTKNTQTRFGEGSYDVELHATIQFPQFRDTPILACSTTFSINDQNGGQSGETETGQDDELIDIVPELREVCKSIAEENPDGTKNEEFSNCKSCLDKGHAYTAIGCIPTDPGKFLQEYVFGFGVGLAGGIAFLLMLWGGFTMIISQGDPQRLAHGREIFVAAVAGLLFIILSLVILRIIGVDIIRIPGFGPTPAPPTSSTQCIITNGACPFSHPQECLGRGVSSLYDCCTDVNFCQPGDTPTPFPTALPTPTPPACISSFNYECMTKSACESNNRSALGSNLGCSSINSNFICCGAQAPTPDPIIPPF